jgi:undecaprenyl-diphosphatase
MQDAPTGGGVIAWRLVTHCGGVVASISAVLLPLWLSSEGSVLRAAAGRAAVALIVSHLLIHLVKRSVSRPRPSHRTSCTALVTEPTCKSFPSGHATSSMTVALAYALSFPALAAPLLLFATAIGCSRVRLGVHYPGDVVAGQVIGIATGIVVRALS